MIPVLNLSTGMEPYREVEVNRIFNLDSEWSSSFPGYCNPGEMSPASEPVRTLQSRLSAPSGNRTRKVQSVHNSLTVGELIEIQL
jgi:hypothetical protein